MKTKTYLPKAIAILFIIVIFAVVPLARSIQNAFKELLQQSGVSPGAFLIMTGAAACLLLTWYSFQLRQKQGWRRAGVMLGAISITGFLAIKTIGTIWVEYTHILTYGLLYLLVRRGFFPKHTKLAGITRTLGTCLTVSLIDEILQGIHPARYFDLRDLLLNFLASLLGALLVEPLWNVNCVPHSVDSSAELTT